jgi:hypothetical protein
MCPQGIPLAFLFSCNSGYIELAMLSSSSTILSLITTAWKLHMMLQSQNKMFQKEGLVIQYNFHPSLWERLAERRKKSAQLK